MICNKKERARERKKEKEQEKTNQANTHDSKQEANVLAKHLAYLLNHIQF